MTDAPVGLEPGVSFERPAAPERSVRQPAPGDAELTGAPAREPRNVPSLLARLRQQRFTGAVDVEGGPGGTLFLRDGLVGAVESPAAPSGRSLLLKSGRIDEGEWAEALTVVTELHPLDAALTARGLISPAELRLVCTAALFDGAFAMSLQPVKGWHVEPGRVPELAVWPGQEPARLVEETARRLRTLRERVPSVAEFARTPVRDAGAGAGARTGAGAAAGAGARTDAGAAAADTVGAGTGGAGTARTGIGAAGVPNAAGASGAAGTSGVDSGAAADLPRLGARGRALLRHADGRRTPRDLAFAVGRGVYPVILDLLGPATGRHAVPAAEPPGLRPLLAARTAARTAAGSAAPPPAPPTGDVPLPRRRPGHNLPPGRPGARPRTAEPSGAGPSGAAAPVPNASEETAP